MFTKIEIHVLCVIITTCLIAFYTSPLWGAGGLITTAIAFYFLLGAFLYALTGIAAFGIRFITAKVRNKTRVSE